MKNKAAVAMKELVYSHPIQEYKWKKLQDINIVKQHFCKFENTLNIFIMQMHETKK